MSQRIKYNGIEELLITEAQYNQELKQNQYYKGLVLKDDGMLIYVNQQMQGLGVTNNMSSLSLNTTVIVGAPVHTVVFDPEVVKEAKQKLESQWYAKGGQANWFYGLGALAAENTPGTFRITNGVRMGNSWSPRYYQSGWRGGSRAGIKTYNVARVGKALGKISIGIGLALDGFGVRRYFKDPNSANAVHPSKAFFNLGVTVYGYFISGGGPISIAYFGLEAVYPGGAKQFVIDASAAQNEANERNQRSGGDAWTRPRIIPWGVK